MSTHIIAPTESGWFAKRYNQIRNFTLTITKNKTIDGLTERETFERVSIHSAISTLLVVRHIEAAEQMKAAGIPAPQSFRDLSRQLRHIVTMLDAVYDRMVTTFGPTEFLNAEDPLALTRAIQLHMRDFTTDEAQADADELKRVFAAEENHAR